MATKKGFRGKITEDLYLEMKKFTDLGLKSPIIEEQFNVSNGTVRRVKNSPTWADYRKSVAQITAHSRKIRGKQSTTENKPEAKTKAVTLTDLSQLPVSNDGEVLKALNRIASATERLADAWEGTKRRKGIF